MPVVLKNFIQRFGFLRFSGLILLVASLVLGSFLAPMWGQHAENNALHARSSPRSTTVVNSAAAITLAAGTAVPLGQSVQLTPTLSTPAPDAGLTVTLTSSDPATVSVTPTVVIAGGKTSPNVQPLVKGLNLGSATITASAPGFSADSKTVNVTAALGFSPGTVTIIIPNTQNLTLSLSGPAPIGGLKVDLLSANTSIATVPAHVSFVAGATTVNVPVTALGVGSTVIHASALPNLTDVTLNVIVASTGVIAVPGNIQLSIGQTVELPLTLSVPAPSGGMTIAMTSSNPNKVTVAPATVTIAGGQMTPAKQPQITGVSLGVSIVIASAPGFYSPGTWAEVGAGGPPAITAITPNMGEQGTDLTVTITGQNTHFVKGTTTADFGAGITVNSVSVSGPSTAMANISIDLGAITGSRTVSLTTGAEQAFLVGGFTVLAMNRAPVVSAGPDQTIPFLTRANLNGSVTDDGLPLGGTLTSNWIQSGALDNPPVWYQLLPSGSLPIARYGSADVYNMDTNRMVIFAGYPYAVGSYLNDLWVLTNANGLESAAPGWIQLMPSDSPGSPERRYGSSSVYDPASNRMVTFGGLTNSQAVLNDLWLLKNADGTTGPPQWSLTSVVGPIPSGRFEQQVGYNRTSNRMIVYGGVPSYQAGLATVGDYLTDLWVLSNANGLSGTPAWTQLTASGPGPAPRRSELTTYDEANDRLIVFGGFDVNRVLLNDTWILSNASGTRGNPSWTKLATSNPPSPRVNATGVYDPISNEMVIFGGQVRSVGQETVADMINETWVLRNANGLGGEPIWRQTPTVTAPSGRRLMTSVFDQTNNRMIIFGGQLVPNLPTTNETWVLTPAATRPLSATFQNASAPATTATFSSPGIYTLRLTASDSELSASSDTHVNVLAANGAPQVSAGPDQTITLPSTVVLSGKVTDDGLPIGGLLSSLWSKVSGPGAVVFANSASPTTTATFSMAGTYVLRLTGNDSQLSRSSDVTVVAAPSGISLAISPVSGQQGQGIPVSIVGLNTHFAQGQTQASFGGGISVAGAPAGTPGPLTITDPTHAIANIAIDSAAIPGARTVTVTTGTEAPSLVGGFTVQLGLPKILSVDPNSGYPGQQSLGLVGSIFLTGHDPDYHAFAGSENAPGAVNINKAAINFITDPGFNTFAARGIHKFLYVTSNIAPPSGHVDGTNGLAASGYVLGTDFDRADASILVTALAELGTKYDAIVVASDFGGILTQAEIDILNSHSADIIAFLNRGGGVYAMAETIPSEFGLAANGLFGFLPFAVASTPLNVFESGNTLTSFGAALGLTSPDINGNFSHNVFTSPGGLNIVDTDPTGEILSLAGRGKVTPAGVGSVIITGEFTHFVQGQTQATFGGGISVGGAPSGTPGPITIQDATHAVAQISIDLTAAVGPRTVTVTTGGEAPSLANGFTVTPPPIINVNPSSGQVGQSNLSVTITGQNTHFVQGTTTADFGAGITVTLLTINSPTNATATLKVDASAPLGTRTVSLTTGSEVASPPNGFTVVPPPGVPTISTISPNSGPQGQGGPVAVVGLNTHFVQGTSVLDLGSGIIVSNVQVTDLTHLTAQVSIADDATGPRSVKVTTGAEVATLSNGFTVQMSPPILTSLVPASGQQGQALPISMTGRFTHFAQGTTQVDFGPGIVVNSLSVTSATSLTAQISIAVNAAPTCRPISPITGTEQATSQAQFCVLPAPIVLSLDPGGTYQGQTRTVAIVGQGTHFVQNTTTVSFGAGISVGGGAEGSSGPVTVSSSTSATAQIKVNLAATPGLRTVVATTGTEQASFIDGFTILLLPSLLSVAPNNGQPGQNFAVTITGKATNFKQGVTQVDFGAGIIVGALSVADPTHLTVPITIASNAAFGSRDVIVATGQEVVPLAAGFTVIGPASITSISPKFGQTGTCGPITIVGQNTHFVQGTTQVDMGAGITVNSVIVSSPTSLTFNVCISTTAVPGPRTVTVTTGSEVVSLPNGFTVMVNQAPVITIDPTWSVALPNTLTLSYTVVDDGLPRGGALTVTWSVVSTPAGGTVDITDTLTCTTCPPPIPPGPINGTGSTLASFNLPGDYTLRITATDTQLTSTKDVTVKVSGTTPPRPIVSITSPADGAEITTPAPVIGNVSSPALSNWVLEYQAAGDPGYTTFATGTTTVQNGTLGTLDPTLLPNGIAHIRLRATDTTSQTTTAGPISLIVTKNQKIGIFTVSFNDLTVPLAGLPIQVVRTYDSRRRSQPGPDFSYGWTLDLKTAQVAETVPLGDQWNQSHPSGLSPYCIDPVKPHVLTASLPDGTTYTFQTNISPHCQGPTIGPISQVTIGFIPSGATPPNASLAIAGNNAAIVNGNLGPVTFFDADTLGTFDPPEYNLTLPDGRTLLISMTSGLEMMNDLNGNTLKVTDAGILHSSGKSVALTRDPGTHRITKITDPAGNSINYTYDLVSGDLTAVTDALHQTTTLGYLPGHYLQTIKDPRGIQPIRNDYDTSGRLISHTDAFGKTITYTHKLDTRQEIVTDRLNNVTVNEYDTDGNVVKVTDALGGVTTRTYDSRDNLLTETNALGKTRTYTYDANNNRLTEKDPLGNVTTYTYNSRNQVLTITDALNRVTTNTYDTNGNLTSTKDPAGNTTTYTYTAQGLRASMTDPLSNITSYLYDSSGNLRQQTDALGNVTTSTYDPNGNKLSETRTRTGSSGPETLVTSYQYDSLNRLTKTTYPDGSTTQIQYNAIGKQSVTTDQLGRQTSYQYDLMGRLTQTSYPDSTTESSGYDAEGDRTSSTDRAGRTTTYVYDALKRLTQTTYPDTAVTKTQYDAIGQVTVVTDARGNVTQYVYDDAGRRTKVTDALNHATGFAYDAVGNQGSMTDANGNTTQYLYDADNRRTKTVYPDNTNDSVVYDALGRTISKTDQAGQTTQFQYDKLGRLMQVTDALNQLTKYIYDEVGNRLTQTDANSHTTTFGYDKMGRRTKRTLPLAMAESYTYDLAGNLKTKTDFNGRTTSYAYDAVNRLTSKTPDSSFGAPVISFTYTATGQRQSMADSSGTTSYLYDLRDRLTQKATPQGTLTYAYDLAGNLASIRSSNTNGASIDYAYDALNRLGTAKDNRLVIGTTSYAYDNAGNLQGFLYPNGVQTGYTYNTLNRLTNMSVARGASPLASYGYLLGPAGNRTQVTETGGRQVNYTYDALYRLKSESIAGGALNGTIGYQYDPVGNRLSRTSNVGPVPATTSTYDVNDRLTTDTYDFNGNTTASDSTNYTYDFENHLKTANGGAVTIAYDGDGNRVAKSVGGFTTQYLVDDRNLTGYAQVLEEISGGMVQRVYTYGLNRISQSQASGSSFYGYDGQGSVRLLSDATGTVSDRYDYDAFGNIISQSGATPNVYLYSGEQNDPNLGLYYLRARYLSQSTGRFWTMDKVEGDAGSPISSHKYAYVGNEPVVRRDPSGNQFDIASLGLEIADFEVISSITTVHAGGLFTKIKPHSDITVHIWSYRGSNAAWGHASMTLNTKHVHISWWPKGEHYDSIPFVSDIYTADAYDDETFEQDVVNEDGLPPDKEIHIPCLDESKISAWWDGFKGTHKWRTLTQNCSTTVADGLKAGGAAVSPWTSYNAVWTPAAVEGFATQIRSSQCGLP